MILSSVEDTRTSDLSAVPTYTRDAENANFVSVEKNNSPRIAPGPM